MCILYAPQYTCGHLVPSGPIRAQWCEALRCLGHVSFPTEAALNACNAQRASYGVQPDREDVRNGVCARCWAESEREERAAVRILVVLRREREREMRVVEAREEEAAAAAEVLVELRREDQAAGRLVQLGLEDRAVGILVRMRREGERGFETQDDFKTESDMKTENDIKKEFG
jgi:hypothetical protein